jgi:dimethylhistidine N-methyltransferase
MGVYPLLKIADLDADGVDLAFRHDVLTGLSERQKAIPARWFYDLRGSRLFEKITELPEYYPTRVELALLSGHGREIGALTGPGRVVVEFGSGSSLKTPLLLREIQPRAYAPIDISGDFLRLSTAGMVTEFPDLQIIPIEANFMEPVTLPAPLDDMARLGFFPGSTIGNLTPRTAVDLLRSMRTTLGPSAELLIGFDRVKPLDVLLAAYDDAQGVTAEFNLNLLRRINRELGADIPVESFAHMVRWNSGWSRIEMHLEARRDLSFRIDGRQFSMLRGETIHTENSHKYTPEQARMLLQAGGWSSLRSWTDEDDAFLIVLAEATEYRSAP